MKRSFWFALLLSVVLVLSACQPGGPAAVEDQELNVLCTPQEEWCQGMKQEFEAKYNITVHYVRMSAGEALARLQTEKDNPQFDVWWGGPIDTYIAGKDAGVLEAYESGNQQMSAGGNSFDDEITFGAGGSAQVIKRRYVHVGAWKRLTGVAVSYGTANTSGLSPYARCAQHPDEK